MSRMDSNPVTSWPSTTTRWRNPPRTMLDAACCSVQSGDAYTTSSVRCAAASSMLGSCPAARESRMSRSVRMPTPECSGSITTAAPTRRDDIRRAASRSVCAGPIVKTSVVMPSRTFIGHHSRETFGGVGQRPAYVAGRPWRQRACGFVDHNQHPGCRAGGQGLPEPSHRGAGVAPLLETDEFEAWLAIHVRAPLDDWPGARRLPAGSDALGLKHYDTRYELWLKPKDQPG